MLPKKLKLATFDTYLTNKPQTNALNLRQRQTWYGFYILYVDIGNLFKSVIPTYSISSSAQY